LNGFVCKDDNAEAKAPALIREAQQGTCGDVGKLSLPDWHWEYSEVCYLRPAEPRVRRTEVCPMANNLHISYDLHEPGKNYERVIAAVKSLGSWAKVHYSFWYVKSSFTADQARDVIVRAMDANDSVYVVDATNNRAAWQNIPNDSATFIRETWMKAAA
jgi:hypothetical protein